jgi:hypothetical protein
VQLLDAPGGEELLSALTLLSKSVEGTISEIKKEQHTTGKQLEW